MYSTLGATAAVFPLLVLSVIQLLPTGLLSGTPTGDPNSQSEFDKTVAALQKQVDLRPNNLESWCRLAKLYSEKVKSDGALPADLAKQHVASGLKCASWALKLDENYYKAVLLNSVLLRQSAAYEKDPASEKRLIAEAEAFEQRASVLEARGKDRQPF
jgi:hypothetical protein